MPTSSLTPNATVEELVAELLPWAGKSITSDQIIARDAIVTIWELDPGLGAAVSQCPWLGDDVDYSEASTLALLAAIAGSDLELAWQVLAWVAGSAGRAEVDVLSGMAVLASFDSQLASQVLHRLTSRVRDLDRHFGQSLTLLADFYPDDFGRLVRQPWFADGLEDEEMALIVPLSIMYIESGSPATRDLFNDLIDSHSIQSTTVSLPLAGDVNIWVLQSTAFPPDEDLSAIIEDTIRLSEGFLKTPFPTTDIILLILGQHHQVPPGHGGTHMRLNRRYDNKVYSIPHETAHYYFNFGPGWFREGGAQFLEAYIKDTKGAQDLADRRRVLSRMVEANCLYSEWKIENISQHTFLVEHLAPSFLSHYFGGLSWPGACSPYLIGENFLLHVLNTIEREGMSSALRELYILRESRQHITEELIYQAFLKNVPPGLEEEFRNLYRRLHGGAFIGP